MELSQIVKETENFGCRIFFLKRYEEDGRYLEEKGEHFIFVNPEISDIAKINVIFHERKHFIDKDTDNLLSRVETYQHRIEHQAERARIIDFINLINEEHPIDDSFNYYDYMKHALIPARYENIVKEQALKLYNYNKENGRI
ncbi:ImmA/IrrE family metallo-endopeptidase [Streptococcus sp. zg-JUN1979]|uniref:ImmA/IrrE family metallo-endopeptidase n=1 Tax=Streptococcus sp. zg-JUN1979 TaxID=3391450 RepID=UPI0039A41F67